MRRSLAVGIVALLLAATGAAAQDPAPRRQRQRDAQAPFQQLFTLRGVEFSAEQKEKIAELRKQYVPMLTENAQQVTAVYTREQRRARREAQQAARQAGKRGTELRRAAEEAVELTKEQQLKLTTLRRERAELVAAIQRDVRGLLTAEQRRAVQRNTPRRNNAGRTPPTHADVKYGPHDRNVMDVWLAQTRGPAPVLVSIHGGGFRGGNKSVDGGLLRACLDSGISVVAITYRLSGEAIAPAQFLDSARAVQFIRHNAQAWNIDPKRMAATGGSAGAGISLWLAFHDDLADGDNEDPVLRESSRLSCAAVYNGQTSYDPRFIRELFPGTNTYKHPALAQLYDVDLDQLDNLSAEKYRLMEQVSPLTHLSKGDAPALLTYAAAADAAIRSQGAGIHHPKFGQVLKEKMDALGIECQVETGIQRGSDEWRKLTFGFVKKHLGVE